MTIRPRDLGNHLLAFAPDLGTSQGPVLEVSILMEIANASPVESPVCLVPCFFRAPTRVERPQKLVAERGVGAQCLRLESQETFAVLGRDVPRLECLAGALTSLWTSKSIGMSFREATNFCGVINTISHGGEFSAECPMLTEPFG